MFRNRRRIHARPNEWIYVHRSRQQHMKRSMEPGEIIGWGIGVIFLAMLVWELIKATYPFLIAAGVIAAIVHFVRKSS